MFPQCYILAFLVLLTTASWTPPDSPQLPQAWSPSTPATSTFYWERFHLPPRQHPPVPQLASHNSPHAGPVSLACPLSNFTTAMIANSGHRVNDIGDYRRCMSSDDSNFCLLQVIPSWPLMSLGMCVPSQCSHDMVLLSLDQIVGRLVGSNVSFPNGSLACHMDTTDGERAGMLTVSSVWAILLLFAVVGTTWELIIPYLSKTSVSKFIETSPEEELLVQVETDEPHAVVAAPNKIAKLLYRFFKCWSATANFNRLITIPERISSTDVLNGIRVISIVWIIMGHAVSLPINPGPGYIDMKWMMDELIPSYAFGSFIYPGIYGVDTFFFMSGFLVAHLLLQEMEKTNKKHPNYLLLFFHRIWRLSPCYYIIVFTFWFIMPFMASSPFWPKCMSAFRLCNDYWWTNLLYINNYFGNGEECAGWTWYLACDMQMFLLSIAYIVTFRHNRIVSACAVFITALVSIAMMGGFTYNPTEISNYTATYNRLAPYFFGILLAYSLRVDKITQLTNIHWLRWCCYILSGGFLYSLVYLNYKSTVNSFQGTSWKAAGLAAFAAYQEFAWGVGLILLLRPMMAGHGGIVKDFLSARLWTPLARLTFGAYLTHCMNVVLYPSSLQQLYEWGNMQFFVMITADTSIAFSLSLAMYLLLEKPLMNLEALILPSRSTETNKRKKGEL
ncbi:transmembrane protein NRF-6 [Pelomyxa schiedti]|nr:transmembrane protein NRF-6 [Pelomyxa schiedti]